jgi:hypothetical protein
VDVSQPSETQQAEPLLTFYQHVLAASRLFPAVQRQMPNKVCDHLGELLVAAQQALVSYLEPTSLDEVWAYEPSLRAPALAFLLGSYQRSRSGDQDLRLEIDRWSSYLWQHDEDQELLPLVDADMHTAEDLVRWFRCHEQLLGVI